jgi:thiosulfate reductase cytochrome b subunit
MSATPYSLGVRLWHWINAVAILCMTGSGWRIYNAAPFFPFSFPAFLTLGDWLGGALAIHFAMMWLLTGNFLVYLALGGLRHRLLPLRAGEIMRDLRLALTFRLQHEIGVYNAVQRLLYLLVLLAIALVIASGLALWKPVQLHTLSLLMGGYEVTRRIHFLAMAGITGFLVLHLTLVIIVPRTLISMLTGHVAAHPEATR